MGTVRNLRKGNSGADVKTLQKNLKKLGYYSGSIDGSFGPITDAAVRKFQRAAGITADGVVGPQTRAALSGKLKKKTQKVVKKAPAKKKKTSTTHEMGRWYGHKFIISPKLIYSFKGLQVKGSAELKDKKDSAQGTVTWKGGNPTEVSLTVPLNAYTGVNVRQTAMAFITQAREGRADYFYVGNQKLVPCKLMLTEASVRDPDITATGKWKKAEVMLTMKQCDKGGGSARGSSGGGSGGGSGGSGGSKKKSVKSAAPSTSKKTTWSKKASKVKTPTVKTLKLKLGGIAGKAATAAAVKKVTASIRKTLKKAKGTSGGSGKRYALTR